MVQEVSGWRGVVAELRLVGRRFVVGVWGGLEGHGSVVFGSNQ